MQMSVAFVALCSQMHSGLQALSDSIGNSSVHAQDLPPRPAPRLPGYWSFEARYRRRDPKLRLDPALARRL